MVGWDTLEETIFSINEPVFAVLDGARFESLPDMIGNIDFDHAFASIEVIIIQTVKFLHLGWSDR